MKERRADAVLLGLTAMVPACLVASHLGNVADAAHDRAAARVLAGDPQVWRSLDVVFGLLLAAVPLGTRAARAALGGGLVVALAGAALYAMARRLLAACAETRHLGAVVAAVAAVTPLLSAPWQIEGAAVGGSVAGALLVLLPASLVIARAPWAAVSLTLGLALGYEPLVGGCAVAGAAAIFAADPLRRGEVLEAGRASPAVLVGLLFGLVPWVVAVARSHASGAPFGAALAEDWSGERALSHGGPPTGFVGDEMGMVLAVLAVAGSTLAILVPGARAVACGLLAIAATGLGSGWLGAALGPSRFGAPVLAGFAAASALAGVAMQAAARAVASARVPMARASASMIVVLELAIPADMADEALVRAQPRAAGVASAWDDAAFGALPLQTVLLVTDPSIYARALAARAGGSLRDDVTLVPTFARDARAWRALSADAALVPLWRDLELSGAPGESSLSSLAAARPVAMAYEPRWGKTIGKHLVPLTLFDQIEPEPRGASDRRRALEPLSPARDRLARAVHGDRELEAAAGVLLAARADLMATLGGQGDLVALTADDARAFSVTTGPTGAARADAANRPASR